MDKRESSYLKTIAIVFMLFHHLFGCYDYLTNYVKYDYIILFGALEKKLELGFGVAIGVYIFISGFGLYKSYIEKGKYTKIFFTFLKFILQYWAIMFLIAIPYLMYFGHFNKEHMLINLFALLHNDKILYVSLSWYVKVYLLFLLVCPLIKYLFSKKISVPVQVVSFVVFPLILCYLIKDHEAEYVSLSVNLLSTLRLLCAWIPIFYMGIAFSRYDLFEKINSRENKANPVLSFILSVALMLTAIFLHGRNPYPITEFVCAFLFIIGCDCIYKKYLSSNRLLERISAFLGKYSFQYWLLSGMFFFNTTEFTWVLFLPKITILIVIWKLVILTPFAVVIQKIAIAANNVIVKAINSKKLTA